MEIEERIARQDPTEYYCSRNQKNPVKTQSTFPFFFSFSFSFSLSLSLSLSSSLSRFGMWVEANGSVERRATQKMKTLQKLPSRNGVVLLGFIRFLSDLQGFFLLGFTDVSSDLQNSTGFHWVSIGSFGFYWVLLGFTDFYWV